MRSGEHSCMAEDKRGHSDLIHSAHAAPTLCVAEHVQCSVLMF